MKRKLFFIALICSLLTISLTAQEYSSYYNLSEQNQQSVQFGINLRANILLPAPGIEFATKFSSKLTLRAGVDFFQYNRKIKEFDPNSVRFIKDFLNSAESEVGYKPDIDMKAKYKTFTGHAVVDYYPFSNGSSFFLSAGLYFGKTNLHFDGMITNPNTGKSFTEDLKNLEDLPEVEITDTNGNSYTVRPTDEGEIILDALIGNSVKPYLGLGFGHSVPKNRVGVKFELGAYYSGKIKLETPNVTQGDVNELVLLGQDYAAKAIYWTRWLPVMSLGLTIRL